MAYQNYSSSGSGGGAKTRFKTSVGPDRTGLPDLKPNVDLSRESLEGYSDISDYVRDKGWDVGMRDINDPQVRNLADAQSVQGIREGERAAAGAIAQGGAGAGARAGMMRMAGAQAGYRAGQEMALDHRKWLTGLDERNVGRRLEGAQTLFQSDFARHQHNEAKRQAEADRQMQLAQMGNVFGQQKQRDDLIREYLSLAGGNRPRGMNMYEWQQKLRAYQQAINATR
jgi:hypothetical protein